jgi:hypothetical protein
MSEHTNVQNVEPKTPTDIPRYCVHVELIYPMAWGTGKRSYIEVDVWAESHVLQADNELVICTNESEYHIPDSNIVLWRLDDRQPVNLKP